MRKPILFLLSSLFFFGYFTSSAQLRWSDIQGLKNGSLNILYSENKPFIYTEDKKLKGIEVEILDSFVQWLKDKKGIQLKLNYKDYNSPKDVYDRITIAVDNTLAAGGISYSPQFSSNSRVNFASPYMKNPLVLVTIGIIPTAYSQEDFETLLGGQYAATISNSIQEQHLKIFRERHQLSFGKILFLKSDQEIIDAAAESERYYGYVDFINYWKYTQDNEKFVKTQNLASIESNYYSFSFPIGSDWHFAINEFLESGLGFTSTMEYKEILKKYLPQEVYKKVNID